MEKRYRFAASNYRIENFWYPNDLDAFDLIILVLYESFQQTMGFKRLVCTSLCASVIVVIIGLIYIIKSSEDPFAQFTFYAVNADNTIQRVWKNVRAR